MCARVCVCFVWRWNRSNRRFSCHCWSHPPLSSLLLFATTAANCLWTACVRYATQISLRDSMPAGNQVCRGMIEGWGGKGCGEGGQGGRKWVSVAWADCSSTPNHFISSLSQLEFIVFLTPLWVTTTRAYNTCMFASPSLSPPPLSFHPPSFPLSLFLPFLLSPLPCASVQATLRTWLAPSATRTVRSWG